MANALVEVSQNLGMGSAAIGLGGASIGIGLVFGSFLQAVARNPAFRSQLFTYAILGFGFVEAMGLFDLMVGCSSLLDDIPLTISGCYDVQICLMRFALGIFGDNWTWSHS